MTETTEKKKNGRPTKRTQALIDDLLKVIAEEFGIAQFCRKHGMSKSSVYTWIREDKELSALVARARGVRESTVVDEIMAIADEPAAPLDDIARRKLQIEARKQWLIWNNPAKFGSKVQVGGAADLPPIQLSDEECVTRVQQLLTVARQRMQAEEKP